MKTLHLIRHADAAGGAPDIERPLSTVGNIVCQKMAKKISLAGCDFENTFASSALRAQETIAALRDALPDESVEWQTDSALYTFEWPELLSWFEGAGETQESLVVVGHNPAVSELTEFLTGEPFAQVPPCTYLKVHAYVAKWTDLYRECGQLVECIFPDSVASL